MTLTGLSWQPRSQRIENADFDSAFVIQRQFVIVSQQAFLRPKFLFFWQPPHERFPSLAGSLLDQPMR